ncbi:hypothetical protein [Neisseria cinerea]
MGRNTDSFAAGVGGRAERDGGSRGKTDRQEQKNKPQNKKCRLKQVQTAFCFLYRI